MRFKSDPASFEAGEVTILAIIETVVAMGVALAVMIHWETLLPIAVGACVAPFFLMRTEGSVALGIFLADNLTSTVAKLFQSFTSYTSSRTEIVILVVFFPLYVLILSFALLGSRVAAQIMAVAAGPFRAMRAIPKNWRRQVFCLDSFHSPEALPGLELWPKASARKSTVLDSLRFREFTKFAVIELRSGRIYERVVFACLLLLAFLCVYLPAIIYRWSIKSTAWVYLPLLWILSGSISSKDSLRERVDEIATDDTSRLTFVYSLGVAVLLATKFYLLAAASHHLNELDVMAADSVVGILRPLLELPAIPIWQIFMCLNALLAIGLFLFARAIRRRMLAGTHKADDTAWQDGTLRSLIFVRRVVTVYVLAVTIYIILTHVSLPPIGEKWFPWS